MSESDNACLACAWSGEGGREGGREKGGRFGGAKRGGSALCAVAVVVAGYEHELKVQWRPYPCFTERV